MKWRWYKSIRLNDISWWININSSPNEIDDKQGLECINFNFKWNNLVTAKWMTKLYDIWSWYVQWLKVIWGDIYHIAWWNVYKNWVKINTTGTLPYTWVVNFDIFEDYILFADWTGLLPPRYLLDWTISLVWSTSLTNTKTNLWAKTVIVYNGKSVWWWMYKDTIVYSKTASASTPALIIDFNAYSAGIQSVWWQMSWAIVWFALWENGLYVFKENAIYYSNSEKDTGSDNPSAPTFSFIFNKITTSWTLSQQSIWNYKQEIFYYDNLSWWVRRLWYEQNLTTLKDTAISEDIQEIFNRLPKAQPNATISVSYPNLKLFLHSENSSINDVCLVYNLDNKAWAIEDNKICSISFWWYLGSPYSNIIYKDDNTYWIDWITKTGIYLSKQYSMWDNIDYKRFWEIELSWSISAWITAKIEILSDWEIIWEWEIIWKDTVYSTLWTTTLWTMPTDNNVLSTSAFTKKIDLFNEWQYIQYRITTNWAWIFELSNVNILYKFINNFTIY